MVSWCNWLLLNILDGSYIHIPRKNRLPTCCIFSCLFYKPLHMTFTIIRAYPCHWKVYQSLLWDFHTPNSRVLLMVSLQRDGLLEKGLRNYIYMCVCVFSSHNFTSSFFFLGVFQYISGPINTQLLIINHSITLSWQTRIKISLNPNSNLNPLIKQYEWSMGLELWVGSNRPQLKLSI